MKYKNLSYKAQIFLASFFLILIPSTIFGIWGMFRNVSLLEENYNTFQETIVSQACATIDKLLAEAVKIAYMPLLNTDLNRAMHTDYGTDYLSYAKDATLFRDQFVQSNRLNQDLNGCMFLNKYGYSFEYNLTSAASLKQIMKNIEKWSALARTSPDYTYFGSLQNSTSSTGKILPMVRIVLDGTNFQEIGICYAEINFKSVEKIIASAQNNNNYTYIYSPDDTIIYVSENSSASDSAAKPSVENAERFSALSEFIDSAPDNNTPHTQSLSFEGSSWTVTCCRNKTIGWILLQISDNHAIHAIHRSTLFSHLLTFLSCILIGLILAAFLAKTLTSSITRLCKEINACEANHYEAISMDACGSNQELCKLVSSFNNLNKRLTTSLEQNYNIRLQEQQARIQMLQFQINHHFLYNTLNVIRSLANIHNIPTIETVSVCMSDLLRYSLEHFPVASLEEELMQVKRYLTIQTIRFPGKFLYDCNVPPQFLNMEVPVMILQPLVENSIEHGFSSRENNCYISILCHTEGNQLHLLIADNGNGISSERLEQLKQECSACNPSFDAKYDKSHHSIGLKNVIQRIQSHFGKEYGLSIESAEGNGTIIDIVLPVP